MYYTNNLFEMLTIFYITRAVHVFWGLEVPVLDLPLKPSAQLVKSFLQRPLAQIDQNIFIEYLSK